MKSDRKEKDYKKQSFGVENWFDKLKWVIDTMLRIAALYPIYKSFF